MITNPFTNKDFAKFQVDSKKAKQAIPLGKNNFAYVYSLFKDYTMLYATKFTPKLESLAKKHNAIYTIIESYNSSTKKSALQKAETKTTHQPIRQIIPRHTLILDLKKSEEELLKKMHPKGRYNIKLAGKKDLKIIETKDVTIFYNILKETATRDSFHINSLEYYQQFIKSLPKTKLLIAYHKETPIAGILLAYFDRTAIYYYGASSNQYRQLMAPYLLQWEAITDAKKKKYLYYDFLGIADPKNPKDPLQGVTYFKQRFGGTLYSWPQSQTLIHKPFLYSLLKIRKFFQNLK